MEEQILINMIILSSETRDSSVMVKEAVKVQKASRQKKTTKPKILLEQDFGAIS